MLSGLLGSLEACASMDAAAPPGDWSAGPVISPRRGRMSWMKSGPAMSYSDMCQAPLILTV